MRRGIKIEKRCLEFRAVWRAFFRGSVKAEHAKLHWRDYRRHCAREHFGISSVRLVEKNAAIRIILRNGDSSMNMCFYYYSFQHSGGWCTVPSGTAMPGRCVE